MPLIEALLHFIAPHSCLSCNTEGSLLCQGCKEDLRDVIPSRCFRCFRLTKDSRVCVTCRRRAPLHHVWVASEYKDQAKLLVQKFKFERAIAAAEPMAELMQSTVPYLERYVVCHVPTATSRKRQRGYDQSQLLARKLADHLSLPRLALLGRHGQSRQVGAGRSERQTQLVGAFYPKHAALIQGRNILLVDDIVTTGATLAEAARTLKAAGAKSVSAVVFAQKK